MFLSFYISYSKLNKKDEEVKLSKNSIHLDINNSSKIKLDQVSLELPNDIATNDISELSNIISEDLKIDKKPNIRKLDTEDKNGFFISEVKKVTDSIIYRLQKLQMRI